MIRAFNAQFAPLITATLIVIAGLFGPLTAAYAEDSIEVTDITGRHVTLEHAATRVVLGDARHIMELGMLLDDPVAHIIGWREDKGLDPARYAAFKKKFPAIEGIATVGAGNRQLSVEKVISLAPDLVILSLIDANTPGADIQLQQLAEAGIPVIYVDFFSHPIENTERSLEILGKVFAAQGKASDLIAFYSSHLNYVRARIAEEAPNAPRVFIQVHATPDKCCATVGGGVFHDFISVAGGYNLGQDTVPGIMGNVGLENLIALDPDFYVATGGVHLRARGGLVIGAGVAQDEVDQSFKALLSAPGISSLRAVEEGQTLAIWHLFNDSPMHIALVEALAKRFHPALFEDLDPAATLREMQTRFSPVHVPGVWWADGTSEAE